MSQCACACAADVEPNITSIRYFIGRAKSQLHETRGLTMSSIPRPAVVLLSTAVLGRGPEAPSANQTGPAVSFQWSVGVWSR